MAYPKTEIRGKLASVDKRQTRKGGTWALIIIDAPYGKRNSRSDYEIKVFGRERMEALEAIRLGSSVLCKCSVEASEWKGRWYTNLLLDEIGPDPTAQVADTLQGGFGGFPDTGAGVDDDEGLPF